MISSDNPAHALDAGPVPNEDVKNLVWNWIKKVVRRFYGSDLFQRIVEALKVPAA
jgi:hypothetical protein